MIRLKSANISTLFNKSDRIRPFRPISRRNLSFKTYTFPSIKLPGTNPIEVVLIGRMAHGSGSSLVQQLKTRQAKHEKFIDEMEEPSSQLFNTNLRLKKSQTIHSIPSNSTSGDQLGVFEDKTAVYSFSVDHSHPFHRHAGHRIFTAISGSGGCFLRFSTANSQQLEEDPENFIKLLKEVHIPGDCIFTLRFDGRVWHQFSAVKSPPAFFAISVHTDETGGELSPELKEKVLSNEASIAALTELLPEKVSERIKQPGALNGVPRYSLSLEPGGPTNFKEWYCETYRNYMGTLKSCFSGSMMKLRGGDGYVVHPKRRYSTTTSEFRPILSHDFSVPTQPKKVFPHLVDLESVRIGVPKLGEIREISFLNKEFKEEYHHLDSFDVVIGNQPDQKSTVGSIEIKLDEGFRRDLKEGKVNSDIVMERLLDSFVDDPPKRVGIWMQVRNVLVKPLKLRTSPLACPVSSLLGSSQMTFGSREFPVRDKFTESSGLFTQILLGANDKHLQFRSEISVEMIPNDRNSKEALKEIIGIRVNLSNKVRCNNLFGRFYMKSIEYGHENWIIPPLLTHTCRSALGQKKKELPNKSN